METYDVSALSDKDFREHLYNHQQICSALVQEGSRMAKILFQRKLNHIIVQHHKPISEEIAYILLTSLNRCLYNYCVLQLNLSFTDCCFKNRAHAHTFSGIDSLLESANSIIDAYAECLDNARLDYSHIEHVCSYIKIHLSEDLSLTKVSSEVYLSKSHLCSIFKDLTGTTFCEYVRQQRIQHARTLLLSTNQSIDSIASACGFNSSTYFATVFKSAIGMTPSAFRQEFAH